jgi:hypothetical protein
MNSPVKNNSALSEFYALQTAPRVEFPHAAMIGHGLLTREFESYALALTDYAKSHFDIIVVDGMARSCCAWLATRYLAPRGFIVFDNADRKIYNDGFRILASEGFKRIDFYGTGPINCYEWCTSIFAKDFDWLMVNTTIPEDQVSDIG